MTRNSIIIAAFSAVHFALTFSLLFYALSDGLGPPKQHREESWPLVHAAATGFEILSQPGLFALGLNPGRNSLSFEFLVFAANSMLWGCAVFCVFESVLAVLWIAGIGKGHPREGN